MQLKKKKIIPGDITATAEAISNILSVSVSIIQFRVGVNSKSKRDLTLWVVMGFSS